MKKMIFLIFFMTAALTSFSQIHVKDGSFHKIDGFVMMDKMDHLDDNDVPMALIKISTENISAEERRKMTFKGNLATYFDVQFKPSEIYLYLSTTATFLEIHHPDYGKTEYWLPEDLCDFCGYELVVVSDYKTEVPVEEKHVYVSDVNSVFPRAKHIYTSVMALNYALDTYKNSSYGFTLAHLDSGKNLGYFLSCMTNFNFFETSGLECDENGFIDGNSCYYTGRVEKSKVSLMLGLTYRIREPFYVKMGFGMAGLFVYWEDTEKRMILNKDLSFRGFDISMGTMYLFDKINVSVDFVSTNAKIFELRLGIGANF